ncbi:MAG: Ribosomal RNA small subunit methyltransferase I [Microgenomates group bacterium GW2011_GWA2_47_8]|nr:MAG: Ribosomal RNA small subunit methyltransferase I [Microgenomates group bacterium GW2011_GWA2_47_8]
MRYNYCMGTLSIVSTPIGNLADITIRAIKTLFSVDIIACEDTRRTGMLLQELKKRYGSIALHSNILSTQKLVRFDDRQEQSQTPLLIEYLQQGKNVALVSDAGTPLISDPGYKLVSEALKRGIQVVSIPGPTAAIAALTSSGLPTNQFLFLGYPPEKEKHRFDLFQSLLTMKPSNHPTIIFYCAPHKLHQTLTDMQTVMGDIPIVIARELTKVHEEVWRGKSSEALQKFENPQGEFVILLSINSV